MIRWESRVLMRHYVNEGLSKQAIADRLGIGRKTVTRWTQDGDLERDLEEPPRYGPRPPVPRKLDPYQAIILSRLDAYPKLSSVRLLEEIQAAGYDGGYPQLKEYVREVRPRPPEEPLIRFETAPGRQVQVDFADFKFDWGKRYALVVVLGYARLLWVRFFTRKDMRALLAGLEEAFGFFGGTPKEVLFDQMKSVITKDGRMNGEKLVTNAEFLRFAAHDDFKVRACRPYRAQTKGKVERPIHYLRDYFVYGREFLNDADIEAQCNRWLERTANVRIHQTIKEQPALRFERDERALPPRPYHSLVVDRTPRRAEVVKLGALKVPVLDVERRPLAAYDAFTGGVR